MKTARKYPPSDALRQRMVRLVHIPAAIDPDGEQRVALEVPPSPGSASRRAALIVFHSMALALSAKRQMENTSIQEAPMVARPAR